MRLGTRPYRTRRGRGRTGLLAAVGPVAVGVILAFAWNTAGSGQPGMPAGASGVTPEVGVTVEQAAAQAWASVPPAGRAPAGQTDVIVTWSPSAGRPASAGVESKTAYRWPRGGRGD